MEILVGTYSLPLAGMEGNGEGIYSVSFDPETGSFGTPVLLAECVNPSSLALSLDGQLLFAGREVFVDNEPGLTAFAISPSGALTKLSSLLIIGELPCHLAFDDSHQRIASAQYGTGDVALASLVDGMLQKPTYLNRTGNGPNSIRQEGPHAHFVGFTDGGNVLHLVDLGTDTIVSHVLSNDNRSTATNSLSLPAGSGPRHLAINRDASRAWVLCELDESIVTLDRAGIGWQIDQVRPGFPVSDDEDGSGAAVRLSPDEQHVYISGRRQSRIAVLDSDSTAIGEFDCGGECPREFIVTPDGRWVISANQASNSLTSLRRDTTNGMLSLSGYSCTIGSPVAMSIR